MGETTVKIPEGTTATPTPPAGATADGSRPVSRAGRLRRMRSPRRPRLWFEILLIAVSYWIYSLVRNAVPEQKAEALRNADWIWHVERTLGLNFEEAVNHAVNSVTWLVVAMNYYYATLHFIVTIAVLVWLYRRHPGRYAASRLILFATTAVALLGYYLYPLAPPRLMPGGHFIDTVKVHETWGSMASGNFKAVSNQYAAMPSMHIGWSLWCGLTIFALAKAPWAKILGLLYPTATLIVIVATANHFWLDAVGGMICLAFGFAVSYAWYGALPHQLPRYIKDDRPRRRWSLRPGMWGRRAAPEAEPAGQAARTGPAEEAASTEQTAPAGQATRGAPPATRGSPSTKPGASSKPGAPAGRSAPSASRHRPSPRSRPSSQTAP
ncbi:phosphatase PAP2 family protein [Streptomyces niveus]|uniref:Phosphatase PAP2 family protein n=1 Tax=Streptomyces niveus TaxID=193462 RepID=A0ABZ2AA93_STRNV|nr:phosphatase PAP2 family protein [Streptomyces niveus]WTA58515.1 phosphatase PAP2 family protein [Streptomyces niveus]